MRVALLGGFEHGILAIPCTAAAVALLPAVLGTFVYRFCTLVMPLPFSFAAIPKLRELGRESGELREEETEAEEQEPALSR